MIEKQLTLAKRKLHATWHRAVPNAKIGILRFIIVLLLIFIFYSDRMSFHFTIGNGIPTATAGLITQSTEKETKSFKKEENYTKKAFWWEDLQHNGRNIITEMNLANTATAYGAALNEKQQKKAAQYSNLGIALNPHIIEKHRIDPAIVEHKLQKCNNYINTYLKIAKEEAELFNIPVSITLAQGLLESNAGDSQLAQKENNHFGIKCKSKCVKCRCANYTDDSKYDMFRIFETPWFSFREHSKLLSGKRYKHLLELDKTDYKNWAHGLQAAGYATDPNYGNKLIQIIETFKLYEYDQAPY